MPPPVRINSENKENKLEIPANGSNVCLVIVEQLPIDSENPSPIWRLSVAVDLGLDAVEQESELLLNTILIGPFIHRRQAVAIAKSPGLIRRWMFWFESDHGRAEALVTLLPRTTMHNDCGLY